METNADPENYLSRGSGLRVIAAASHAIYGYFINNKSVMFSPADHVTIRLRDPPGISFCLLFLFQISQARDSRRRSYRFRHEKCRNEKRSYESSSIQWIDDGLDETKRKGKTNYAIMTNNPRMSVK
jgi:hypothetical protein